MSRAKTASRARAKTEERTIIDEALIPDEIVFQGTLDPIKLLAGGSEMINATLSIMEDMKDKKFIFNLGHGILPRTPIDNVKQCIDLVKNFKD